jgi:hypothetical protein
MKRRKSSFVGLLMSLSLALTPPTHARINNYNGTPANNDTSSHYAEYVCIDLMFAGHCLSLGRVMDIAEDPVVSWGAVHDDQGNAIQGEAWVIVARNDTFIYFHLTDTPNPATDTTAYGGYTVKVKAIMTNQFYNFGYGGAVPVIGNDTDAFLVTTTKMMVNSAFIDGEVQQANINTGTARDYLVHLYDVVQSYSQPPVLIEDRWIAMQFVAPDGTELTDPVWNHSVVTESSGSSSSVDCKAFGDGAGDFVNTLQSVPLAVNSYANTLEAIIIGGVVVGSTGGLTSVGVTAGTKALEDAGGSLINAVGNLGKTVTHALYSGLAEGACNAATNALDSLPPLNIELPSMEDFLDGLTSIWVFVCTAFGEVVTYSGGEVTVTSVCVAGHWAEVEE